LLGEEKEGVREMRGERERERERMKTDNYEGIKRLITPRERGARQRGLAREGERKEGRKREEGDRS
jgi:hypothetical protein